MALWHITRVATPNEGTVNIDCSFPLVPMQVDLHEDVANINTSIQMCWDPRSGHLCDNLDAIGAEHNPNDWGADCP